MTTRPDLPIEALASEDEWIFVSGALQVDDLRLAAEVYETLALTCESSGWFTVCPHRELLNADFELVGDHAVTSTLYGWTQSAISEAQACVVYVGRPSSGVGMELSLAAANGRPIIALHLSSETPSPLVVSLLEAHESARTIICDTWEECYGRVRALLSELPFGANPPQPHGLF